jgi:hypothetical protein
MRPAFVLPQLKLEEAAGWVSIIPLDDEHPPEIGIVLRRTKGSQQFQHHSDAHPRERKTSDSEADLQTVRGM